MKKGFSLIEMLLVVLIFTFLFGAILTVLSSSDKSWRTGQNKFAEQQEARRAMDDIARLLRQSNPDWVIVKSNPDETCKEKLHNPVTITESGKRIDFYKSIFYPDCCPNTCGDPPGSDQDICRDNEGTLHNAGDVRVLKITFKLNPGNPTQLLKKEGVSDPVGIANEVEQVDDNLSFAWKCSCDPRCINSTTCRSHFSDDASDCNNRCTGCTSCCDCYYKDATTGQCICCSNIESKIKTKKETTWIVAQKVKGFTLDSKITLRNQSSLPAEAEVEESPEGEF